MIIEISIIRLYINFIDEFSSESSNKTNRCKIKPAKNFLQTPNKPLQQPSNWNKYSSFNDQIPTKKLINPLIY